MSNRKKAIYIMILVVIGCIVMAYVDAIVKPDYAPELFVLLIAGLFAAGLLFNRLDEKYDNIYVSWLVHMCANFSINTIGFILFGII